jgi:protein-disulfide isomerase
MTRRRNLFLVAAALAAVGIVLAALLTRQHAAAHAGLASACNLNDFINCDRVATSRWSVFLGLPVAVWGLLGYGLLFLTSVVGLRWARPEGSWPAGLLFAGSALATAVALVLALVSELGIGALCLYCAGSWGVSAALLATSWRACRPEGVAAALREDLAALAARPVLTAGTAVGMAVLVALTARAQPRYWEKPPPRPVAVAGAVPQPSVAGPPVIVEFSDYECPFCAKAHLDLKALLAARPDVQVVKRHFPLDTACNPLLRRPMHRDACALARGAICAEQQGRFTEMDDALFANQKERRPVEELAKRLGLDVAAFQACLADPETARRLSKDVATGIQIGLKATPTYVVNGVQYAGTLPPTALPPPVRVAQ